MTTTYRLYWTRADDQGSIQMGDHSTAGDAFGAIDSAKRELIEQGMTPEDADAGHWEAVLIDQYGVEGDAVS